jgi:hypothetical protein
MARIAALRNGELAEAKTKIAQIARKVEMTERIDRMT